MHLLPGSRHLTLVLSAVINLAYLPLLALGAGGVATDGTLGHPAQTLTGPNFTIGANLGQTRGGNLFHSFSTFDLSAGQTATFTGPSSIHDVFARVTGPDPAAIDGTLSCTIPNATFFLIDPNGVMFGPEAKLDVKGSFAVTTADTIKLGSSGSFSASKPQKSVLTTAAPSAFGFLSPRPVGISVQGATLAVPRGHALSVVSGPVQIVNGQLIAPAGRVNILAVGSAGQAKLDASAVASPSQSAADVSSFTAFADVILTQESKIDLNGSIGGALLIQAADFSLDGSVISSTTRGDGQGLDGDVAASRSLSLSHGAFLTFNIAGRGGDLLVSAHDLTLGGTAAHTHETVIATRATAKSTSSAIAGDLTIHATDLLVTDAGIISATTFGSGHGGDAAVTAHTISIDGSETPKLFTGIATESNYGTTGDAGNLSVHATDLSITDSGEIAASTFGSGNSGDATVTAHTISIDGSTTPSADTNTTGIFASSYANGNAGNLTVHATDLSITNHGVISTGTSGSGSGGELAVTAHTISINGSATPTVFTGIAVESNAGATGDAGNLSAHATDLSITDGGEINADTNGSGHGGNLAVTANTISIDGSATPNRFTGIAATSNYGITGDAGNLTIHATDLSMTGNGEISASTFGSGRSGDLTVTSRTISMDGSATPSADTNTTGVFADSYSTAQRAGAAGDLTIQARTLRVLAGAEIDASTYGPGHSGNLTLTASRIILDDRGDLNPSVNTTGVFADSESSARGAGAAGDLAIHAGTVRVLAGAEISVNTYGPGHGGNLTLTASRLILDDTGDLDPSINTTGVLADSEPGASGTVGDLTIQAGTVRVLAGAEISASTLGSGLGGDLTLTVSRLILDDTGDLELGVHFTGVFADSQPSGRRAGAAGNLTIHVGTVRVLAGAEITAEAYGSAPGGDLTLTASRLILDDRGDLDPSVNTTGVFADSLSGATGAAGDLTIQAGTVRVLAGAKITAATDGSGLGGDLTLTASRLILDDTGDLAPSGNTTGVFADSESSARKAGDAGDLTIQAGTVRVLAGAEITAGTDGSGLGGDATVTAHTISIDGSATPTVFTGIAAESNPGATGDAGNLSVHAIDISITNHGDISASTFGSGHGGDATVTAHAISIDGSATSAVLTGINVSSYANGNAGNLTVQATDLSITGRGEIAASTSGSGHGGDLAVQATDLSITRGAYIDADTNSSGHGGDATVTAHTISIHGSATPTVFTGIAAESNPGATGDAGNLSVHATDLSITSSGEISASTSGSGHGGDLAVQTTGLSITGGGEISAGTSGSGHGGDATVMANTISIDGSETPKLFTGITAESNVGATGDAGNLSVHATDISITGSGDISTSTFGSGTGGNVAVAAQSILVEGSNSSGASQIVAESKGKGAAGSVQVFGHNDITLSGGGTIAASSKRSRAGDVEVASDGSIVMRGGIISAEARLAGGNVSVSAPLFVELLHHSEIITESGQANGGNITIDPLVFSLLSGSHVSANAPKGEGGDIIVDADKTPGLVFSGPSRKRNMTATGETHAGQIANGPANNDIAQSLAQLPTGLASTQLTLQPQCGQMVDLSTFLIQGRGGVPEGPGEWQVDFNPNPWPEASQP